MSLLHSSYLHLHQPKGRNHSLHHVCHTYRTDDLQAVWGENNRSFFYVECELSSHVALLWALQTHKFRQRIKSGGETFHGAIIVWNWNTCLLFRYLGKVNPHKLLAYSNQTLFASPRMHYTVSLPLLAPSFLTVRRTAASPQMQTGWLLYDNNMHR